MIHRFIYLCYALISLPSFSECMTFDEKIGQLFIAGAYSNREDAESEGVFQHPVKFAEEMIIHYHVGGVLFKKRWNPEQVRWTACHLQRLSTVPLLTCLDAEWGLGQRMAEGESFPKNRILGFIDDLTLLYEVGLEIGWQCREIGINFNFSPVVDVDTNPMNPVINERSFGPNPMTVGKCGIAMMKGLQDSGVLTCAKHFPGHGDTSVDSHTGMAVLPHDLARLQQVEFVPFKMLVEAGVDCVMGAHLTVPILDPLKPASLSAPVLQGILKQVWGFQGLIITDDLIMGAISQNFSIEEAVVYAFLAGNDLLLLSRDIDKGVAAIRSAILIGRITEEELNRRVEKIQLFKRKELNSDPISRPVDLNARLYAKAVRVVQGLLTEQSPQACIQLGGASSFLLDRQLKKSIHLSLDPSSRERELVVTELNQVNKVVLAFFDLSKRAEENFGIHEGALLLVKELTAMGKEVVVVLFGNPEAQKLFQTVSAVVAAHDESEQAQHSVEKLLF
jgi:beta-N-acetylhexosaminidase